MKSAKIAGASGLVFVVMSSIILFVAPVFPTFKTPAEETLRYYLENNHGFLFANYAAIFGLIPSLIFASFFADKISEQTKFVSKSMFVMSVALSHAVAFVSLMLFQVTALVAKPGLDILVKFSSDSANITFCFYLMLQGLYLFLFAGLALCGKLLPQWAGWAAIPIAFVSVVTSFGTVIPAGPLIPGEAFVMISSIGICLWIAAVSIHLLKSGKGK